MLCQFVFVVLFVPVEVYRTSMCSRNHEQFSLCGWRCPPTCVNLKLLAAGNLVCPSVWDCRVGCRCSAGYVRDEYSKNCILVQNCPEDAVCPQGEVMGTNLQCIIRRRTTHTNESVWNNYEIL